MSDAETIFALFGALYLFECLHWPAAGTTVFFRPWAGRWASIAPHAVLLHLQRGVFFANPLLPVASPFDVPRWPVSLSPDGCCAWTPFAPTPGGLPEQTRRFHRWTQIRTAGVDGRVVRINDAPFCSAFDNEHARWISSTLLRLARTSDAEREAQIRDFLAQSMNSPTARNSLEDATRAVLPLQALGMLLFLVMLVVGPAAGFSFGFAKIWTYWLPAVAVLWLACIIMFWRAHAKLHPEARAARMEKLFNYILLPVTSARAADTVVRNVLYRHHPVAVARILLRPAEYREFAARVVRDVRYPSASSDAPIAPEEVAAIDWFVDAVRTAIEAALREAGLDPDLLASPPVIDDPSVRAFCPRCHDEFVIPSGTCESCGGIALQPRISP